MGVRTRRHGRRSNRRQFISFLNNSDATDLLRNSWHVLKNARILIYNAPIQLPRAHNRGIDPARHKLRLHEHIPMLSHTVCSRHSLVACISPSAASMPNQHSTARAPSTHPDCLLALYEQVPLTIHIRPLRLHRHQPTAGPSETRLEELKCKENPVINDGRSRLIQPPPTRFFFFF